MKTLKIRTMQMMGQLIRILLLIILVSLPALLMAQPIDPGGDDVLDNPVPFDGGVSLLVAAGIGYGLKKAHEKRKADKM